MLAEFRGVPNTEAGSVAKAKAEAAIHGLHLDAASGVLVLYWQGGDTFCSWLLCYRSPPGHFGTQTAIRTAAGTVADACMALQKAGIPFTVDT